MCRKTFILNQHLLLHAARESLLPLRLALHLLADLNIDLEELGDAAVEAHGLALVQIRLAVGCVDALCRAGLQETRKTKSLVEDDVSASERW